MDGRVAVVTGGNSGIGKETAVGLAALGARVVISARDEGKGTAAVEEIRTRAGRGTAEVLPLDLASFATVRDFAAVVAAACDRVDVLVLNAGIILAERHVTVDGHEAMFQTNHLGHFLLTGLLRDRLVASGDARVVVVASDAHRWVRGGLPFDDLESERRYRALRTYGRTKLMNILFARELARRWRDTGVTANAVHPGFVASNFAREGDTGFLGNVATVLGRPFARSPEQGARTSLYVASAPELDGVTGRYFASSKLAATTAAARDDDAARRLWDISAEIVGIAS